MRDRLGRIILFDFIIFLEDMRLDFIIPVKRVQVTGRPKNVSARPIRLLTKMCAANRRNRLVLGRFPSVLLGALTRSGCNHAISRKT